MKLVEQWWKAWSVKLLIAANAVAGLAVFLPEMRESLPEHWYQWAFGIILIARIIKQQDNNNRE